jgi:hypothetical protein
MELYPSGQFRFIDDPDRQFGNSSVSTRTRTRCGGPEPLITPALSMYLDTPDCILEPLDSCQGEMAEGIMPNNDIVIINCSPNDGLGLGDFEIEAGSVARSGSRIRALWIVE